MPTSLTKVASGAEPRRGMDRRQTDCATLDWAELHRRLDAADAALERRLRPGAEEKRKILRARARALAAGNKAGNKKDAASQALALEVVEFVVGPEHYGIESSCIREIYPLNEFTPLPCTPSFVLGLINVRGQILSLVDIKKLFDLPEKGLTNLNRVIIVHANHMEIGILADAILGVCSIAASALYPALPTLTGIREEYLRGITKDSLVVLDVGKILSDKKILVDETMDTAG
ncbi:MAG: chemotaxis protein CheW [Candidatus Sulfotelmatobacter sp.]